MSRSARIGLLTTSFPRRTGDAAGAFVLGLARALRRLGHRVEVVAPEPAEQACWEGPGAAWLEGVQVIAAPYARPRSWQRLFYGAGVPDNLSLAPWSAALVPPAVAGLYLTARRRIPGWDALISHWIAPSALIAAALRRNGSPTHLAIAHSADLHLLARLPLGRALAAAAARGADRIGLVAAAQRAELESLLGPRIWSRVAERVVETPMGIEADEIRCARPRRELRAELGLNGFAVLCLGRLVPIKGVDLLIEAAAGRSGWQLLIAGDGPQRGELERLARARGVEALFCGEVGAAERARLLAACDALVLPSRQLPDGRHEGLPLVLLEAMASRLPVVAADTGGVAGIVEHDRCGLLVPPESPAALGRAVQRLAVDVDLARRLADRGQGVAREREWARLAPGYQALLGLNPPPAT